MNAKEYLSQAYYIDREINAKLEVIDKLNSLAMKTTSTISDMPGSPNRNVDKSENIIVKIIDLENEITERIDYLVELKREIFKVINSIDDKECTYLLEQRYICFKKWEDIAVEMGCSVRSIYRLHGFALKKLSIPENCQ